MSKITYYFNGKIVPIMYKILDAYYKKNPKSTWRYDMEQGEEF